MPRGRNEFGGNKDMEMAKNGYRDAKNRGDKEEEARWANQIGHLHKNRGEYVEALKWFRIDYQISLKHLPQKQLMPTCQSIGEMYLRLEKFDDALVYQEKHLEFAQQADDLAEQQRASTQLGRTYFDLYEKDEENYSALEKAKSYMKMSMELARALKDDPPDRNSPSFVKELVNAYNNMGLLKICLEDYVHAEKILMEALRICDEEEIGENDEGRTRIHHNLGRIYIEKREWEKAKEHVNIDIKICQSIPQPQGEACGLINLGLIYYKIQDYERALSNYRRALEIARNLEDEDSLVHSIKINIQTAEEAQGIADNLVQEEQKLKKLLRNLSSARGTSIERRCLVKVHKCLKTLMDLANNIEAWPKHLEFSKKNKNVVDELGDAEKLTDALLEVGESYYNLRMFEKAKKWYLKSWKTSKSIGNAEGQAVAKINIGNSLDSAGDWREAVEAYKEGYKIAVQGNALSSQLTALENMHNSYIVRFSSLDEARKLEGDIERVKRLVGKRNEEDLNERCPETDSEEESSTNFAVNEGEGGLMPTYNSPQLAERNPLRSEADEDSSPHGGSVEAFDDGISLATYLQTCKRSQKSNAETNLKSKANSIKQQSSSVENRYCMTVDLSELPKVDSEGKLTGRKRARIVISDDEKSDENAASDIDQQTKGASKAERSCFLETEETRRLSFSPKKKMLASSENCSYKDMVLGNTDDAAKSPYLPEVSNHHTISERDDCDTTQSRNLEIDDLNNRSEAIISVCFEGIVVTVDTTESDKENPKSIGWLITEAVQLLCLQNHRTKKLPGMKPVVEQVLHKGILYDSRRLLQDLVTHISPGDAVNAIVKGWFQMSLSEKYMIFCRDSNQFPNSKLLSRLLNLKASGDVIVASNCELDDQSVLPLIKALSEDGSFCHLDFSHNALGNQTMHRIQEAIAASSKNNVGLTLDWHDNRLGASALLQICECPVSLSRLEVLNLSKNCLTDAAGRILSTCIKECKALAILNLEECGLTGRTIKLIADALSSDSGLLKLSIGKNNPLPGHTLTLLLEKLACLKWFENLDMKDVELDKLAIASICKLFHFSSSILSLTIGGTSIGMDGVLKLSDKLVNRATPVTTLDLSFCGLGVNLFGIPKFCKDFLELEGLIQLNLSGNPLKERGATVIGCLLSRTHHLRILRLNRCQLGQSGILKIIQALSEESLLQELHLAGNVIEDAKVVSNVSGCDECCVDLDEAKCNVELSDMASSRPPQQRIIASVEVAVAYEHGTSSQCQNGLENENHHLSYAAGKEVTTNKVLICDIGTVKEPYDVSEYDVADSEEEERICNYGSSLPRDHTSSSHIHGLPKNVSQFLLAPTPNPIQFKEEGNAIVVPYIDFGAELSAAVRMARNLQMLDLSDNSISAEVVEHLYVAWSTSRAQAKPSWHTRDKLVHFTIGGKQCCDMKMCCSTI